MQRKTLKTYAPKARATKRAKATTTTTKAKRTYSRALPLSKPVRVNVGRQAFPIQLRNTLKYSEIVSTAATALTINEFSANGIFACNFTSTSGQPMYFDQLSAIYGSWVVNGSTIKVTPLTAAAAVGVTATIVRSDGTTVGLLTTIDGALQNPRSSPSYVYNGIANRREEPFYSSYVYERTFGTNPVESVATRGTAAANPTDTQLFALIVDRETGTGAVKFLVEIMYDVTWSEVVMIAES